MRSKLAPKKDDGSPVRVSLWADQNSWVLMTAALSAFMLYDHANTMIKIPHQPTDGFISKPELFAYKS